MSSPTLSPSASSSHIDSKNPWTPPTRNPVSLRLYKVLGTNFNDEATQEAFRTLSDLYATPVSVKGKEVKRDIEDLEDEDEDEDVVVEDAVSFSEVIPGESAARARKNLRRDMENKLAEGSYQFLRIFGEVDQKLDELQQHVAAMRTSCDEAEAQLRLTDEASKTLLERAGNLREERNDVETRKSIVSLFLAQFTLNEEEVEALTSRDVPIGKHFFQAMDKTERIRSNCRVLMAGEDESTKAGSDIMASTASHLELGYEKLVRWCTYEFMQMGKDDAQLEVGLTMREAIRRLRRRPALLTESLTTLSQTRQTALLSSFLTALTRGVGARGPRPIELHAHDPLRYIGDMLAWVHQAIAAEREFLEALFGMKSDGRMVGSVRVFRADGKATEEEEWVGELMDLSVGKLCVPLKARVQQTIRSQESSIISYKVANLLQFYMITMRRTLGDSAILTVNLHDMTELAFKVFYDSIEAQGRALLRVPLDITDDSLTPPLQILDHMQILREIMAVYQSSLLGEEEDQNRASLDFERIANIMVDPALQMCVAAAEEKKRVKPKWDQAVFVLNCLTYLQNVLEQFSFTVGKRKSIQDLIDERVTVLTDEHYSNILIDAGIKEAAVAAASHGTEPLSRIPAAQPGELQTSLRQFSLWLSSLEVVQSPRLSHLTVQRLHSRIHQAALERMARAYQVICEEVKKPENKYEAASTLLGSERPFGQVHLLWQIFGLEETDGDDVKEEKEV